MRNAIQIAFICLGLSATSAAQEAGAIADVSRTVRICATPEPTAEEARRSTEDARGFTSQSARFRVERVRFVVPVAFHVIHDNGKGNVTDQQIDRQLRVLNEKLGPEGYLFTRHSISRTNRTDWHVMVWGEASEIDAKIILNVDSTRALNFYIAIPAQRVDGLVEAALGLATFPWWTGADSWDVRRDGVIVAYSTLPGSTPGPFDQGFTGVHEVGHWIGLLHTFNGDPDGCTPPGDEVADTANEFAPYFGPGFGNTCPAPSARNSCPDPAPDPIRNYMDYADDRCMSEWTAGQSYRALNQMQRYRASFVAASPDVQRLNRILRESR